MLTTHKVKIFCSYSHRDEELREELEDHLALLRRQGMATVWHDRRIEAGGEWRRQIDRNLESADIILLLISKDFLDSDYCFNIEMTRALERHRTSRVKVIPVILRACDWESARVGAGEESVALQELQALPVQPPPSGRLVPVTRWTDRDEAFTTVAKAIRKVVEEMAGLNTAQPADRQKPLDKPKPEIPDLLPHLCDRARQDHLLVSAIREWKRQRKVKRPLVCIVHGSADECHEMFQRRLKEVALPPLLRNMSERETAETSQAQGEPVSVDDFFIPLPNNYFPVKRPFDFLQTELGRAIADNMDASTKEIVSSISQYKKPLMFYSYLSSHDWEPDGRKLIEAYLQFWGALPEVASNTPIVCCLFFKYGGTGTEKQNAAARKYLNDLSGTISKFRRLRGVVLEELTAVGLRDAENWINDNQYFRNLCRVHPRAFCNIPQAVASITDLFNSPEAQTLGGRLPMQVIAPKLIQVVIDNHC